MIYKNKIQLKCKYYGSYGILKKKSRLLKSLQNVVFLLSCLNKYFFKYSSLSSFIKSTVNVYKRR